MGTNPLKAVAALRAAVAAAALVVLGAASVAAQTHTVHLRAEAFAKAVTLPNGSTVNVPMWGYGLADDAGALLAGGQLSSPGPRIVVPEGTATLEVVLHNQLPAGTSTSLVIPGQPFAATPDRQGGRVVSMTPQVPSGQSRSYTFTGLKPGTFLYQSGSHQAVQVQMGLYGAVTMNAAAGFAYAGVGYDSEVVLVYSEVDRALHQAVADGRYGTAAGPTSTIDYYPTLFLVNGRSYANDVATPPLPAGTAHQTTLVRLLNAGLRTHAPVLDNGTLTLVAEDGNRYPVERPQATVLLAAGKTLDATWTPTGGGVFSLYDRSLSLNAPGHGAAGMLAKLQVASAGGPNPPEGSPVAVNDEYSGAEDAPVSGNVLSNDSGAPSGAELVTSPSAGTLAFGAGGSFTYTPGPNFFGVDVFSYRAVNASGSSLASVTITVTPAPDGPAALAQSVGVNANETLPLTLAGTDGDGDALTFYLTALPPPGAGKLSRVDPVTSALVTLTASDLRTAPNTGTPIPAGSLVYQAAGPGPDQFSFVVSDDAGDTASAAAAVAVTVHPPAAAEAENLVSLGLDVVGPHGEAVSRYYWTLEEDRTYNVVPGASDPDTLSVSFHPSYMPVKRSGDETTKDADLLRDPAKRYFVSVLPKEGGYSNGGAPVAVNQGNVTVKVNQGPIPTARIRVRVFHDNAALNGQWDTGEPGLSNFAVTIEDAGGRYGMSAAQQLMDAFGNPIGTKYKACVPDEAHTCPPESYEVESYGGGFVLSDAEGWALVENLAPGKYGVKVVAPGGTAWQQTATIEGTRVIDAWVKANEPSFFSEFGPPGAHAEIGFTQAVDTLNGTGFTISGQVTNLHHSRPPSFQMFSGAPFDFTRPWVALNTGAEGGTLVYAQPTDEDGNFTIDGVPGGTYQLVIFDSALNLIIANKVVNVTGNLALNQVPVQQWFTRLYNYVFEDTSTNGAENGFRDAGEAGIAEQAINLRWRDGSMYQSMPTDTSGFVPFEQVFPFFSWLVAEVDYTRHKATGVTAVVDGGGNPTNTTWPTQVGAELDPKLLMPQPQSENGGNAFRTETGPVLLQAFQGFLGQSSVLLWGKAPYAPAGSITTDVNVYPFDDFPGPCADGQVQGVSCDRDANGNGTFDGDQFHGGVSGIVHYSTTRAENDPRWGGAEVWEPGIAGVTVQLWSADRMRLLNEVTTDSWDDSLPTGCQGPKFVFTTSAGPSQKDCFDGLRNFNQVRPGVFDGGYAFLSQLEPIPGSLSASWLTPVAERGAGFREVPLPAGRYVVRVVPPRGYKVVREEDKNVDFGDEFVPQQFYLTGYPLGDGGAAEAPPKAGAPYEPLAAPFCVGSLHEVPAELALFGGVPGAYAGERRPLCDQKLVTLRDGQNPGANFFLFTEAPVAGHIVGFVLDDTANEFDPNSPQFGEKYAPPFMPISIRDWRGREITSTHTDAFGRYNALVPSTYTANQPIPSGMSPSMLTACINSPTTVNESGLTVPNPHHYKQYTHFCYTFQYMPGTTTYLDTPVLPTGAFAGTGQFPVDAELPSGTPAIAKVTNIPVPTSSPATGSRPALPEMGPYVIDCGSGLTLSSESPCPTGQTAAANARRNAMRTIEITSAGFVEVPNPAYAGPEGTEPKTVLRDYTFGPRTGSTGLNRIVVRLGGEALPTANVTIAPGGEVGGTIRVLRAVIPAGSATNQLSVERCVSGAPATCPDWRKSVLGVTLTVATRATHDSRPPIVKTADQTIQQAIDAAPAGALVLVPPGQYEEMVVMRKPVRLQGWGAFSTVINAVNQPAEKLETWRSTVAALLAANNDYLLPSQLDILGAAPLADGLAAGLGGEGAGVTVLGRPLPLTLLGTCQQDLSGSLQNEAYCRQVESLIPLVVRPNARIDGFSIVGAMNAAGVMVNANARNLEIGNNRITNNVGDFGGGIRVGHAGAVLELANDDALNHGVAIHNNVVAQNAGMDGAGGGGIVIGNDADGYRVADNFVAGNFTGGRGAGIAHIGRSPRGVIDRNAIVFNEGFNQGLTRSGGGLFVGGTPPAAGELTPGSGSVSVTNNLIQGNLAASGDGGGIALDGVNGGGPDATSRSRVGVYNNIIVNNAAGLAGGGVSLHDAAFVDMVHNTVARNDSFGTAGGAFAIGAGNVSTPQPAGIVSRAHTPALDAALPGAPFSQPTILNSIVWQNRSFYFGPLSGGVQVPGDPSPAPVRYGLLVAPAGAGRTACTISSVAFRCWDLGVLGAAGTLTTQGTTLTGGGPVNFATTYVNASRNPTIVMPEQTSILVPMAFDEGGTFVRPIFGPLTLQSPTDLSLVGNYHVTVGTIGVNVTLDASRAPLLRDIDGEARPSIGAPATQVVSPDRGADEKPGAGPARRNPLP